MSFKAEEFRDYFVQKVGAATRTAYTYNHYLSRIDQALGGLDEAIASRGSDDIWRWARTTDQSPFDTYASNARSSLKRYLTFLIERESPSDDPVDEEENITSAEIAGSFFKLEREMQAAVRTQLEQIESGLKIEDGGREITTATGRVDILARDAEGILVAIELKAGDCTPGALEQVLGYAQAMSEERGERVRAMLIASAFSDRIRAAAKRAADTKIYTYQFSLRFVERP